MGGAKESGKMWFEPPDSGIKVGLVFPGILFSSGVTSLAILPLSRWFYLNVVFIVEGPASWVVEIHIRPRGLAMVSTVDGGHHGHRLL